MPPELLACTKAELVVIRSRAGNYTVETCDIDVLASAQTPGAESGSDLYVAGADLETGFQRNAHLVNAQTVIVQQLAQGLAIEIIQVLRRFEFIPGCQIPRHAPMSNIRRPDIDHPARRQDTFELADECTWRSRRNGRLGTVDLRVFRKLNG